MEDKLDIGETVQLKSGGPIMTITDQDGELAVKCCWFPGECDYMEQSIPKLALRQRDP